jgi:hypothetical protein
LATTWQQLASFQALVLQQDGSVLDQQEKKVGAAVRHNSLVYQH